MWSAIYQQCLTLTIKQITAQAQIQFYSEKKLSYKHAYSDSSQIIYALKLKKDPFKCFGFEWKECDDSPLDILDESNCLIIEEQIPIETKPVRIELDDSLLDRFNELSEDELKDSFGTFRPVQSLNPYMTKLTICSIKKDGLVLLRIVINQKINAHDHFLK